MTQVAAQGRISAGRDGARWIRVWDPLVRLTHWSVALIVLSNALNDADGVVHERLGYAMAVLVVLRLAWGVVGSRYARFSSFPPNPVAALRHVRETFGGTAPRHLGHNPLGALMVYNLWATLLGLAATGYMMGTMRFFGVDWVEELHEGLFTWLLISVALHVGGVIFESLHSRENLVRAMIDGRKQARTISENRG